MCACMMRVYFCYVHSEPGERAKVTCVNKSCFFLLDDLLWTAEAEEVCFFFSHETLALPVSFGVLFDPQERDVNIKLYKLVVVTSNIAF